MANKKISRSYGLDNPLQDQFPSPVIASRAPTANDTGYPLGQRWVDKVNNLTYTLTSVASGAANWEYASVDAGTTTVTGIVRLATVAETVAGVSEAIASTPAGIAAVAIAGCVAASEGTPGIAELATQAETVAYLDDLRIVTPLKLGQAFAEPAAIGSTTAAAGNFTTLGATGLITGGASATITTGAVALNLGADAAAGAINIGTGAAARVITVGNVTGATSISLNAGTGGIALASTGTGDITLNSDDTLLLDADGVLELNSSAGAINIGNDADANAINVGTGAAARTITIGNITGATDVTINTGTAGFTVNTTGAGDFNVVSASAAYIDCADVVELNSTGGAIGIGNDANAFAINIGTGAAARTITIGNVTGATALAFNAGTGGIALASTGAGDITINSDDTLLLDADGVLELNSSGGIIGIGNDADAFDINIGTGAAARTITMGNITGATAVNVNTGTGGMTITNTGAGNFAVTGGTDITLDCSGVLELNSSAGVIGIGNDAVAQNINIGTGAAARVITIGNITDASQIVLNSGTGGIQLVSTGTGDITLDSDDTLLLDADGVLELNSSGGAINIGNDADAQAINIGTGAAARTITVGNSTGATQVALTAGTGGIVHTGKATYVADAITATDAGVAASVDTVVTEITTNGDTDLDNVTLANGVDGQIKIFVVVAVGNVADSVKITPASMIGGAQITFAASPLGLGCHMYYDSGAGGWIVSANNGGTIS